MRMCHLSGGCIFAGCSSKQSAEYAFYVFKINCDRRIFAVEIRQEGNIKTFISTCKIED